MAFGKSGRFFYYVAVNAVVEKLGKLSRLKICRL